MSTPIEPPELFDLRMSEAARPLFDRVTAFLEDVVAPMQAEFFALGENHHDRWQFAPGQLELLDGAKAKAKEAGLWNFFLPDSEVGGLSNLDYAYIAVELGKYPLGSESLNCSAPDTGNMEVLERVGTPEQKKQWLEPLLNGEIRSAYAMTEPDLASSDAKNVSLSAVRDGDEYVLNGEKYYISGAGDPRCKIMIVMCKTNPDAATYQQQSQILVPMDTPGVQILGPMHVFGHDDAPHGHMHLRFDNVRVPATNMLLGEGRGFEISQVRLGPGRIHHCMRAIGQGEKALELMIRRGKFREAFGKPILSLGKNMETVSRARIELDACRLMVLKAAKAMDILGNAEARVYVSAVKAMVPEKVCQIIDQAIQIHGATGVSQWTPLAAMYTSQRTLRLADGPDEVHHFVVARHEAGRYSEPAPARSEANGDAIFAGP
ncbi:MAG TPA: acyl-CoA dehydrogenase family protein [Acidimicrobiales bacterium]|nr:acyl-CoA dehydrogenase family protein [Acidimicrobiales bacterium]